MQILVVVAVCITAVGAAGNRRGEIVSQNTRSGTRNYGSSGNSRYTTKKPNAGQGTCAHQCVPYYQCKNGEIINDGQGIIDLRIYKPGQGSQDVVGVGGSCPNILDVCCRNKYAPTQKPVTPPPYKASQCGLQYDQSKDQAIDIRIHLNKTKHKFDNVAQFGAYPWMAAILKTTYKQNEGHLNIYQCGGSLIDKQVVLTAAHCVETLNPSEMKIRLGEWDTQSTKDHPNFMHVDYYVSKVVMHKKYYRKNVFNDIALIFLSKPVQLNYHIQTICLPSSGQKFDGQTCYASGWGKDNFGQKGKWQAILKEIDLPIVSRSKCQQALRTSRLGCNFCLHDSFICAGGVKGKDTCTGDGGSPLVCYNQYSKSYVQAGIVAWGIGCGSKIPGVYVDVSRYTDWINFQINQYFTNLYKARKYKSRGVTPKPYYGRYISAYGKHTQYYEGDQLFIQCKTTPTVYPVGHSCYRAPRPRPQQTRRPNPRPGSGYGNQGGNQQGSGYQATTRRPGPRGSHGGGRSGWTLRNPNIKATTSRPSPGGNYGSNSNQQGSGYSSNQGGRKPGPDTNTGGNYGRR